MNLEFVIPVSRDGLLKRSSVNQYCVEEVLNRSKIPSALQDFKHASRNKAFSAVDHFDTIFSVLVAQRELDGELVEDAWQSLLKATRCLHGSLASLLEEVDIVAEARQSHMTAVKMTLYLLCQFIEMYEAQACQVSAVVVKKGRGKATKKATSSGMDWEGEREEGVRMLVQMLHLHLHKLWDPPVPEEDFVRVVSSCLYKLLENPAITSARSKETRDAICHGIGALVKRYNHALSAGLKVAQLLKHFAHLVSPMTQLMEVLVNSYGNKSVVGDVMREIGRMDPRDAARDPSGALTYSQFLVGLGEKVPAVALPNVSVVLCHLDEESYSLRNGVLGMMGEIVVGILSKDDLDAKQKLAREGFFDLLQDHIHDMHAFVRSKVLQIWLRIVKEKCLLLSRQETLVGLVLGRLQDTSSLVRRFAIQLFTAILMCNPYAAKLSVEELAVNHQNEAAKLEQMMPQESSALAERPTEEIEEEWAKFLPALKEAAHNMEEEEGSGEESTPFTDDDTSHSVLDKVYTLLIEEQYLPCLQLLRSACLAWPDLQLFHAPPDSSGDDSEMETSEDNKLELVDILKRVFFEHRGPDLAKITEAAANSGHTEHTGPEVNEVSKQQVLVQYLKDTLAFARQVQESVPIICQLLGSHTTTDVLEAVQFFVTSHEFGLTSALQGIRRMLALVWSKEQSVKDAVVAAYRRLYLQSATGSERAQALSVVRSLSQLMFGATIGDLTALDSLLTQLMRDGEISAQVIQVLWERFTLKIADTSAQESRAALHLISMVAGAEPDIIVSNLEVLIEEGLGPRAHDDFLLAQAACQAILKLATKKKKGQSACEPFRLPPDHHLFTRLVQILVEGSSNKENIYWIPLAERAVKLIYRLADQPDSVCGGLIHRLAAVLKQETQSSQEGETSEGMCGLLAKLLALSGQVALQQLVYMEVDVLGELKRRNALQEDKKNTKSKRLSKRQSSATGNIDEEMGLAGASADDAEAEYIRKLQERDILSEDNLLGAIKPLLLAVCTNPGKFNHPELQTAACLALAKFMTVSWEFCEQQLQLMFTLLEKSSSEVVRSNSIIALGDITSRFPNLIEPWTPHLYGSLRDASGLVRNSSLQVLSHLILNDMVKVKGQISQLAVCMVDQDERMAALSKLFFQELANKGNALYNLMPDAISRLSDPELGVEEEHFRTIMKYLFSFIQKDKLCESLVEKLCHRYRTTVNERQCRDLSFCLSLLTYNERSLRKLQDNFSCFADKLQDPEVFSCFTNIVSKSRGGFAKAEAKVLVDELEEKLEACHLKGVEEGEVASRATKSSTAGRKAAKTPGRKGRGKENKDLEESTVASPAHRRSSRRKPKPVPKFDSDEDDNDDELFDVDEADKSGVFEAPSPVSSRSRSGRVPLGKCT